jgi:hypothetical protein
MTFEGASMIVSKLGAGFLFASVLVLGIACDKGEEDTGADTAGTGEETGTPMYSHAADIQPLWDVYCVEVCHSPEGIMTGGMLDVWGVTLDMSTSELSMMGMIDVQSELYPTIIVTPGSPDDSYLMGKLLAMPSDYGGGGLSMPQPREGLPGEMTADEIQMVSDWIAGGAMP